MSKQHKQLIFGLGTGRCGTWSLTRLLDAQANSSIAHEEVFLTWVPYIKGVRDTIVRLLARPNQLVGDVGFYYLNYIDIIMDSNPEAKFICLKRDKTATVNSWMHNSGRANYWTALDSKYWNEEELFTYNSFYFPKYDLPKREAIAEYWEDYYRKAKMWELKYPNNFRIWDISALNTNEGIDSILDFVGIPHNDRVYKECHFNRSHYTFVEHKKMPAKLGTCEFCRKADSAEWCVIEHKSGAYTYVCDVCRKGDLGIFNLKEDL